MSPTFVLFLLTHLALASSETCPYTANCYKVEDTTWTTKLLSMNPYLNFSCKNCTEGCSENHNYDYAVLMNETKCLCGYEDSISSLTDKKISCSAECPTKACIIVQVYSTTTKTVETTTVKPVVNNIHIDQLSTLETIDFITSGKDVSDCLNNCSHRGLCVLDVGNNKYACNCTSGYYGENCQLSVNPCYSYPCLNNATCSYDPVNNTYECKCSGFYSGTNCESKITMCNNITCSGHGSCVNQPNSTLGYSCQCYYFYSGSDCQVEDRSKKLVTAAVSTSVVISIFMIMATCGLVICLDLFKLSLFYSKQLPRSDYRVKKLPKSEYFQ